MTHKYLAEVMQRLQEALRADKPSGFADLKKYIGTHAELLGLSAPRQQAVFKTGFSFSNHTPEEQLAIWDQLWKHSSHHEVKNLALMFVSKHRTKLAPELTWSMIREWVAQTDNWAHSDGLSALYADLLEQLPRVVYQQYVLWNTAANPWERRQSLVGLLYYSRLRKVVPSFTRINTLLKPLLKDEDYFVQKGVGWTLRETWNVYPEQTLALLTKNIAMIHPAAFAAATEKLPAAEKEQLKQLRKAQKKK